MDEPDLPCYYHEGSRTCVDFDWPLGRWCSFCTERQQQQEDSEPDSEQLISELQERTADLQRQLDNRRKDAEDSERRREKEWHNHNVALQRLDDDVRVRDEEHRRQSAELQEQVKSLRTEWQTAVDALQTHVEECRRRDERIVALETQVKNLRGCPRHQVVAAPMGKADTANGDACNEAACDDEGDPYNVVESKATKRRKKMTKKVQPQPASSKSQPKKTPPTGRQAKKSPSMEDRRPTPSVPQMRHIVVSGVYNNLAERQSLSLSRPMSFPLLQPTTRVQSPAMSTRYDYRHIYIDDTAIQQMQNLQYGSNINTVYSKQ